jgi:hypothetical protein
MVFSSAGPIANNWDLSQTTSIVAILGENAKGE